MSKTITVCWETTDQHHATFEVPDDWSPETGEEHLMDLIVEVEGGGTSDATLDRVVVEVKDAS